MAHVLFMLFVFVNGVQHALIIWATWRMSY